MAVLAWLVSSHCRNVCTELNLRLSAYDFWSVFLAACGNKLGVTPTPLSPTELPALSPTVISQALTELGFAASASAARNAHRHAK